MITHGGWRTHLSEREARAGQGLYRTEQHQPGGPLLAHQRGQEATRAVRIPFGVAEGKLDPPERRQRSQRDDRGAEDGAGQKEVGQEDRHSLIGVEDPSLCCVS